MFDCESKQGREGAPKPSRPWIVLASVPSIRQQEVEVYGTGDQALALKMA